MVLFDELVRADRLRRVAVYVGSEAARGAPQLRMPRPEFATHSVAELESVASGVFFRDRPADPALAYGQAKYIAALWMAAEARRHPSLRLVTMSPGNTGGTDLFRDFPLVPRLLLGAVLKPVVLPLLGLAHGLQTGARRLLEALEDERFTGGRFYASRVDKLTGPVVDQSEIVPDLARVEFQDHAAEAMQHLTAAVR